MVRLRTNLAVILLLVAGRGAGYAAAQDAGSSAGADLTPTARELSDQALRQYQEGRFDAAIESFMGAFALSNNPGLLFNVAQAYRLKGDCEHARDYYRRYLGAVPDSPFRPSLERRVAEMEACVKTRGPAAPAVTTIVTPAAPRGPERVAPTPEVSPGRRAAVWTLRGSAATLLASSAVFGALAWDARRDFESAPTPRAAQGPADRYATDTALAWSFAAIGLACAVASYIVDRQR